MVMAAIVSAFYVVIDIANWFVRATQYSGDIFVLKYSQDTWFFYIITFLHGAWVLVCGGAENADI